MNGYIKRANRFLTEDTEDLEEKEITIDFYFKDLSPDKQREIVDAVVAIGNAKEAEANKENAGQPEEDETDGETSTAEPEAPAEPENAEAAELEALAASYVRNANRFLGEEEIKEDNINEENNEAIEVYYKDIDNSKLKETIIKELLKAVNAAQDDDYAKDKIKEELIKKSLINLEPEEIDRIADVDAYTEEMVANALENKPLLSTKASDIKEEAGIVI